MTSPDPEAEIKALLSGLGVNTASPSTSVPYRQQSSSRDPEGFFGVTDKNRDYRILWSRSGVMPEYAGDLAAKGIHVDPRLEDKNFLESLKALYGFDRDQFETIQDALVLRGMVNPRYGGRGDRWDKETLKGWRTALEAAAVSGDTIWEVLGGKDQEQFFGKDNADLMAAYASMSLKNAGPKRAPLRIELTDPDDLKTQARDVALATLGYTPTDDFLDEFVGVYQGMESGYQKKAYGAAETGGRVTRPGDPRVEAEKKLKQDYSTEAAGFATVRAFQDMMDVMGVEGQ